MTEHRDLLEQVIEVGDTVVYSHTYTSLHISTVTAILPKTVRLESLQTLRKPREVLIIKKHNAGVTQ